MTTTKDKSPEGPYRLSKIAMRGRDYWTVVGTDGSDVPAMDYVTAKDLCDRLNAAYAKGYAAGQEDRWISVEERLPEKFQIVALVHVDKWWNTGRDEGVNCYDAGYLNEFGDKYWSVRGERALSIDAYTHWMPLPASPTK